MRRVLIILIMISIIQLFIIPSKAYASWYAYFMQSYYYGIWATIYTPSYPPYFPMGSGQSNSVTTSLPYWMQAGWLYNEGQGFAFPQKYYEYCAENCENDPNMYHLQELGDQTWGTGVKYEVSYDSSQGAKAWCAWVGGYRLFCKENIQDAPATLLAQSEVHTSPRTEINTYFLSVRLKTTGDWNYPDLYNLFWDFPYKAERLTNENFRTYRQDTIDLFLPIIMRQ